MPLHTAAEVPLVDFTAVEVLLGDFMEVEAEADSMEVEVTASPTGYSRLMILNISGGFWGLGEFA